MNTLAWTSSDKETRPRLLVLAMFCLGVNAVLGREDQTKTREKRGKLQSEVSKGITNSTMLI